MEYWFRSVDANCVFACQARWFASAVMCPFTLFQGTDAGGLSSENMATVSFEFTVFSR